MMALHEQATATLFLAQTETRLLRTDMQKLTQDVFQRVATQLAYVQNSSRSEYAEQLADVERHFDERVRSLSQQVATLVSDAREEIDAQIHYVGKTVRGLAERVARYDERLNTIEKQLVEALPEMTAIQQRQLIEIDALQRNHGLFESAAARQVNQLKATATDTLTKLREVQAQLTTKVHVLRTEMQQQSVEQNQQMQVLVRGYNRLVGRQLADSNRPATPVIMTVGVTALLNKDQTSNDCFLHAKAALTPHSDVKNSSATPTTIPPKSATSMRPTASIVQLTRSVESGAMEATLHIQSSTLSKPLGREEQDKSRFTNGRSPRKASVRHSTTAMIPTPDTIARCPHAPRPETAQ